MIALLLNRMHPCTRVPLLFLKRLGGQGVGSPSNAPAQTQPHYPLPSREVRSTPKPPGAHPAPSNQTSTTLTGHRPRGHASNPWNVPGTCLPIHSERPPPNLGSRPPRPRVLRWSGWFHPAPRLLLIPGARRANPSDHRARLDRRPVVPRLTCDARAEVTSLRGPKLPAAAFLQRSQLQRTGASTELASLGGPQLQPAVFPPTTAPATRMSPSLGSPRSEDPNSRPQSSFVATLLHHVSLTELISLGGPQLPVAVFIHSPNSTATCGPSRSSPPPEARSSSPRSSINDLTCDARGPSRSLPRPEARSSRPQPSTHELICDT